MLRRMVLAGVSACLREEFGDRAKIVVIPHASHALIPEQPAAVADAIVTWIGTLPRQP
jgi:pimeloyl-ACP methyl ester carboxylesterase